MLEMASNEGPPSYQDATSRGDWLAIVARYISAKDYPCLCIVSKRFYTLFCPLLWKDPLVTVRLLGLDPGDDLEWYSRFIFKRAVRARASTRQHVLALDYRHFAKATCHFAWKDLASEDPITASFKVVPKIFPNLKCILLDGHTGIIPTSALEGEYEGAAPPLPGETVGPVFLSLANAQTLLPQSFYQARGLNALTWLDISALPGSLKHLISASNLLPHLRVLKARRRELTAPEASDLITAFGGQLWSLDLSDNPLPDTILSRLGECMIRCPSLRSSAQSDTEGVVEWPSQRGTFAYGPFYHIKESTWSSDFSHPNRYLADSPSYRRDDQGDPEPVRLNGRTPMKEDSVDHLKHALTGDLPPAVLDAFLSTGASSGPTVALTHLHISNTRMTSFGIEKLVRTSGGHLELLDCDTARIRINKVWPSSWPKNSKLYGILGAAHLFRPVLSSNLRALRIHHSLVTQIPGLEADSLSSLARIYLSETILRARSEMAYPQSFTPDTNPRLTSLTLTKIPRRSSGPIIIKLINFLKLASTQERAIADATVSSSLRAPEMLRGLRRICLEFESDPMEDPAGFSTAEDLDAEEILNMGGEGFSFFADEYQRTSELRQEKHVRDEKISPAPTGSSQHSGDGEDGQVIGDFHPGADGNVLYSDKWGGNFFRVRVWVGPGESVLRGSGSGPVNTYMRNVRQYPDLRRSVGSATPAHIAAGVPAGSLIFHDAWHEMLVPVEEMKAPSKHDMARMKDVLDEIKKFRVQARSQYAILREQAKAKGAGMVPLGAPHYFWTGNLEVAIHNSMAHYQASEYWR